MLTTWSIGEVGVLACLSGKRSRVQVPYRPSTVTTSIVTFRLGLWYDTSLGKTTLFTLSSVGRASDC